MENLTEERGREIASHEGQIKRIGDNDFQVKSQSREFAVYSVSKMRAGWICSCPDYQTRGVRCKHIFAVRFSRQMREEVKKSITIEPVEMSGCLFCHSPDVVKTGIRKNKEYAIHPSFDLLLALFLEEPFILSVHSWRCPGLVARGVCMVLHTTHR